MKNKTTVFQSLDENNWWDIFQYGYMFSFEDKIYYSKIENLEIVKEGQQKFSKNAYNHNLSGDLEKGFQIDYTDEKNIVLFKNELKIHLGRIIGQEIKNLSFTNEDEQEDIWINIMEPTDYNPVHIHSGYMSFVIYLDVKDEIRQEHKEQIGTVSSRGLIEFFSKRSDDSLLFNPRAGDILIFDSTHKHTVYPFYSDCQRVTIAGNIYHIEVKN